MVSIGFTITCPFCFQVFNIKDARFRCGNNSCPDITPDTVYAKFQGLLTPKPMGKVFEQPDRFFQRFRHTLSEDCPTCKVETHRRVCPNCHYELMHDAGTAREYLVAVIGGRSTGKSNYIATLIHRLENEVGSNFNAGIRALGDNTRRRYEEDFYTPLFRRKEVIPPTQAAAVDPRTKVPLVYRVTFNQAQKSANLVLFDTAGEDMQSLDTMSTEARYILQADAIIFLLDPLQIDAVRQQLPNVKLPPSDPGAEPVKIVERLRELYERKFHLRPTEKINKPIAFTLSKIDMLFSIIDPASPLHRTGEHFGYYNDSDLISVHAEIQSYLDTWTGPHLNNLISNNFSKFCYCAMSSFGGMPINDRHVEHVSSIRVEDPLIWMFYQLGLIKNKK